MMKSRTLRFLFLSGAAFAGTLVVSPALAQEVPEGGVTTSEDIIESLMLYALASEGYRFG